MWPAPVPPKAGASRAAGHSGASLARPPWPLVILAVALALWSGLSVRLAPCGRRSLEVALPLWVGLGGYIALLAAPLTEDMLRWMGRSLFLCGAALCLLGMLGLESSPLAWWRALAHSAPFVSLRRILPDTCNPNVIAGAWVALFPFVLGRAILRDAAPWGGRAARGIAILLGVAMLTLLWASGSRGAYLGVIAGALALCWLHWPGRLRRLSVPLLAVALLVGSLVGWHRVLQALLSDATLGDLAVRLEVWTRAWRILQDFCFTGIGIGCLEGLMARWYPLMLVQEGTLPHVHNLFLQVAVDLGLPGWGLFMALFTASLRRALQAHPPLAQAMRRETAMLAAASIASEIGLCTHGLLDSAVWDNKGAFLPWLVMGLGVALWRVTRSHPSKSP